MIINNSKGLAELKGIAISFDGPDAMPAQGDPNQLKTLFMNIIENAFKYTPDNGRIGILARSVGNIAEISIKDTGPGIPQEEISHIFDRFYRVDKSRSSSGFGLGLSIAKAIVEAHEGTISVSSLIGNGTTFTIALPASNI